MQTFTAAAKYFRTTSNCFRDSSFLGKKHEGKVPTPAAAAVVAVVAVIRAASENHQGDGTTPWTQKTEAG